MCKAHIKINNKKTKNPVLKMGKSSEQKFLQKRYRNATNIWRDVH